MEVKWDKALIFENVYEDEEYFWFTEYEYGALFRMEKENQKAGLIGIFPGEALFQERLYISTVMCGGELFFAPYNAKEIAAYNLETGVFRKIPLPVSPLGKKLTEKGGKFCGAVVILGKVYFIPAHYPGILCYDPWKDVFTCFDGWVAEIEKVRANQMGYFCVFEKSADRLILPCACAEAMIIFDTGSGDVEIIHLSDRHHQYSAQSCECSKCIYCGISQADGNLYLVSGDGTILRMNSEGKKEQIEVPVSGACFAEFYPVRYLEGYLNLFPYEADRGYRIDTRTGRVMRVELFETEKQVAGNRFPFLTVIISGGKLYAVTGNSRRFVEYDFEGECRRESVISLSLEDRNLLERYRKNIYIRQFCREKVRENDTDTLKHMLEALEECQRTGQEKERDANFEVGKEIYHWLTEKKL